MKVLIAYDTTFGNTEGVAREIAGALGKRFEVTCKRADEVEIPELRDADLVLVGGPTHFWGMSGRVKKFFDRLEGESFGDKLAAAFDTKYPYPLSGSAAPGIERRLRELGFKIVVPYMSFYIKGGKGPLGEGELKKCARFAENIAGAAGTQEL